MNPPLHLGVVAIEKGAFRSPSTKVANFTYLLLQIFKTMEKSEFRVLTEHCFLMEKMLSNQRNGLISFSISVPSERTVKRWYADFKRGCTDTNDVETSVRPNLTVVPENTKKLHKLVLADRKLYLLKIAEELKISESNVFNILHGHFVNEKAVFKVGAAFAQSRSKTTPRRRFISKTQKWYLMLPCLTLRIIR